ncbi:MAG: NADH-quinone oxidoreductase subunit I [Polyangia bacterium]
MSIAQEKTIPFAWKKRTSKADVIPVHRARGFGQQAFIPAIVKGMAVSLRHFFDNVATRKDVATIEYPEEQPHKPERYRGLHRLMHREDGAVRCVACQCCSTACPAHCITIVAEDTGNSNEKRPAIFEIDELRCVVCGLCVEACPCDAIRMDGGIHAPPVERRVDSILGKTDLLKRGTLSAAIQGGNSSDEWRDQPLRPNADKLPSDQ